MNCTGRAGWTLRKVCTIAHNRAIPQTSGPDSSAAASKMNGRFTDIVLSRPGSFKLITDPKLTSVCAVAWPEEMPVNETIDLQKSLKRELGLNLDQVFLNGMYPELFDDVEAGALSDRLEREADSNGAGAAVVRRAALRAALSEHQRATSHREQLDRLEQGLRRDVVERPFVFRPQLDMSGVELLADQIEGEL